MPVIVYDNSIKSKGGETNMKVEEVPKNIRLNRYIYNCKNALRRGDKADAQKWYDKAFALEPNDWRVMWMYDNFYKRPIVPAYDDMAYYLEEKILERDEWLYDE